MDCSRDIRSVDGISLVSSSCRIDVNILSVDNAHRYEELGQNAPKEVKGYKSKGEKKNMRYHLVDLLVFVILCSSAAAEVCQYGEIGNVTMDVPVILVDGQKYYDEPVISTNFKHKSIGQHLTYTCIYQDSFDLVNHLPIELEVQVRYTFQNSEKQLTLTIPAFGTETISEETYNLQYWGADCINNRNIAPSQLEFDSIKITCESGQFETSTETQVTEVRICKECPEGSGQICLNDGEWANADYLCGSGKRDSKGICLSIEDQNALIPKDFGQTLLNLLFGIVALVIIIIFILAFLRGPSGKTPLPDKIIHIWER